jgi:hypothetical protein
METRVGANSRITVSRTICEIVSSGNERRGELVGRLHGAHRTHEDGNDHHYTERADADLGALVHEFLPVHLQVLGFRKHPPDHLDVAAYVGKKFVHVVFYSTVLDAP